MSRYEHHFTVCATKDDAGIHWAIVETDPEHTIWDTELERWVDIDPGDTDDSLMFVDLKQRLYILT